MALKGEGAAKPTRRRGAELEAAILTAGWEQLARHGYPGFTIESVAERACTSRPVLYRRWPTRTELLRAVIAHRGAGIRITIPDTGSLREDVLAALRDSNSTRSDFLVMLSASLGEYYAESGTTPRELRAIFLDGHQKAIDAILDRAVERGEIDADRLTPRVAAVPFDLYRHEVLMSLRPVGDDTLVEIVDEAFLPLVT